MGGTIDVEKHVRLLEKSLLVLPYILPSQELVRPVLLHHDLHADNIFVDEEDPTKVSSIIVWQALYASPLFLQARFPAIFDSDDWGAVNFELPKDFDTLSQSEKQQAKERFNRLRLKKFYELATRKFNPLLAKAMDAMKHDDDPTIFIFHIVGQSSINGPIPLQELLVQIYEKWDQVTAQRDVKMSCPISFSSKDIGENRRQAEAWADAYGEFGNLRAQLYWARWLGLS